MRPLSTFSAHWPAISALLDEALALPATRHQAWLDALTGDPAVHRDALQALLAHRTAVETDDFLGDGPRLDMLPIDSVNALTAGALVGPWRLVAEAGRGGMSTVWQAERADGTVKRRVALKLPRLVWGDVFAERLDREREILGALEHEHIARFHDAGVDAGGRPWLAMAYVEGRPIDVWCRERRLDVAARIGLLLQVCAAVAHAHSRLVVHRDLKPGNILVTADGQVRLLDFGIAKLLEGENTRSTALTELNGRVLTLDYASPEQIHGAPLGTASDVYSLGVVAYELLAEGKPYRLRRGSAAEMEEAIASAEPRLASEAAASPALAARLRGDLDAILNKALKKRVADRYPGVDAFASDLSRHLAGRPVLARPDSRRYRATRFVQRNRLAVGLGSALSLAIVGGVGLSLWQTREARQHERRANIEVMRQAAVRDLYLETLTRLSVMGTDSPSALTKPNAVLSTLREKLDEMAPRYRDTPAGRAAQLEAVMLQLNYANDFDASLAIGREYLNHLRVNGGSAEELINAHNALGRTLFKLGRRAESEAMRRAGVAWAPDVRDDRTETAHLDIRSDLAGSLAARGARSDAEDELAVAESIASRRFAHDPIHAQILMQLSILWTGFDDARSLGHARQADAILSATGASPDDRAYQQTYLGTALMANGLATEAESTLTEAHDTLVREYGRGSTNEVRALARLAAAVAQRGDRSRAEGLLADEERMLAASPAGIAPSAAMQFRWRRADIAWLAGDTAAAAGWSLDTATPWLQPGRMSEAAPMLNAQARLLVLADRAADAASLLAAMRLRWSEPGLPTVEWLRLLETQAMVELALDRPAAARRTAEASMAMLESQHATTGRMYVTATEHAALAAARLGSSQDAARLLDIATRAEVRPPFPTRVAEAESALRRAEVLTRLARTAEGRATARAARALLEQQVAHSPRLALADRLAAL